MASYQVVDKLSPHLALLRAVQDGLLPAANSILGESGHDQTERDASGPKRH
jgi:hypothetical protein